MARNNSVRAGVVISIEVGVATFLLIAITDMLALRGIFGHAPMLVADVLASLLCTALVFQLWHHMKLRQDRLLKRFEVIAEMNHHIRNALQEIQYSAYATQNPDLVVHIRHASDRINWALHEILPQIETDNLQSEIPDLAAKGSDASISSKNTSQIHSTGSRHLAGLQTITSRTGCPSTNGMVSGNPKEPFTHINMR
jgi:hypothetical protein